MKKFMSVQSTGAKLSLGIMLSILLSGALFLGGMMLGCHIFGIDTAELQRLAGSGTRADVVRYMLVVQALVLFIAPSACIAFMLSSPGRPFIRTASVASAAVFAIASAAILFSLPFVNLLAELNRIFLDSIMGTDNWMAVSEAKAKHLTESLLLNSEWSSLALNIAAMAILPAVSEELFFRGTVQGLIERGTHNAHIAVIASALLFSAMHIQFYGFVPRAAMGIFMGYLYVWYRSLWLPILVHFVNNAAAVTLYFLIQRQYVPRWVEHVGSDTATIGMSIASFACLMYAIVVLAKRAGIPLGVRMKGNGPVFRF